MNAIERKRFIKLADFLEELPEQDFYFGDVVKCGTHECGTVCCAIGWTPRIFPDLVRWRKECPNGKVDGLEMNGVEADYDEVAETAFGIPRGMAENLFCPHAQYCVHGSIKNLNSFSSPKDVAAMMRQFLSLVDAGEIKVF